MVIIKQYTDELDGIQLGAGFFEGWPNPPTQEAHRRILQKSYVAFVAVDTSAGRVVGFVNALSDGVLSAYIPLLEVLPDYRRRGIGANLVKAILGELKELYMLDLCCDQELQGYYEKLGMVKSYGMIHRNYQAQSGIDK
ncbi:MAG: GNAT family N-acetyltransferase [Limnochordia bacterium]|jgi:ribosomal protein S18 acetylase RimI-like enzyme|nr:GNAT family N-acetyltransferase [Limnochordia bacterium]